jgi:hypothetical protein
MRPRSASAFEATARISPFPVDGRSRPSRRTSSTKRVRMHSDGGLRDQPGSRIGSLHWPNQTRSRRERVGS